MLYHSHFNRACLAVGAYAIRPYNQYARNIWDWYNRIREVPDDRTY